MNVASVPLGVPLLAGPGAIAASMVLMSGEDGQALALANQVPVAVGIFATVAVVYLALRYSLVLERVLKDNGIHLITGPHHAGDGDAAAGDLGGVGGHRDHGYAG